jgi:hypothetical protein
MSRLAAKLTLSLINSMSHFSADGNAAPLYEEDGQVSFKTASWQMRRGLIGTVSIMENRP